MAHLSSAFGHCRHGSTPDSYPKPQIPETLLIPVLHPKAHNTRLVEQGRNLIAGVLDQQSGLWLGNLGAEGSQKNRHPKLKHRLGRVHGMVSAEQLAS